MATTSFVYRLSDVSTADAVAEQRALAALLRRMKALVGQVDRDG